MASDTMFMENLEEYILDENRVVTYKWLSRTLGVNVNQAKQMLYKFVDEQRNQKHNDDLAVVYFIAGVKQPKNGDAIHKCVVLPEEKVDSYKSSLSTVTSEHIYSVQKSKLKDSNALFISDFEKRPEEVTEYNKHGVIKCESAVLRPEEDLKILRGLTIKEPAETTTKAAPKTTNEHVPKTTSKSKSQPKSAIAGMFATAGKTTVKKEVETKTEKKEEPPAPTVPKEKPTAGMKSFFNKQTASSKAKNTEEPELPKEKPSKEKSVSGKSNGKQKGKKTRRQDSDDDQQTKKRRRIRNDLFDSSSEEEDVEMEPESPVPSPPRETTPPRCDTPPKDVEASPPLVADTPSPTKNNNNNVSKEKSTEKRRKRKRKLVPKTFMDDQGYMVTEKVWESDSTDASEVEDPIPAQEPKKNGTKVKEIVPTKKTATTQRKSSPPKGKQASLMSFFKKK